MLLKQRNLPPSIAEDGGHRNRHNWRKRQEGQNNREAGKRKMLDRTGEEKLGLRDDKDPKCGLAER